MKNVVVSIPLALAATLAVFASAFAQSNKDSWMRCVGATAALTGPA